MFDTFFLSDTSSLKIIDIIQSAGIIVTFAMSALIFRRDLKSRKIESYISLVQYHRDLWKMTLDNPALKRIREDSPCGENINLSYEERTFLTFLFLHITCSYELYKFNQIIKIEQLKFDISELFTMPLVKLFWNENKKFYNNDFSQFIDSCINQNENTNCD